MKKPKRIKPFKIEWSDYKSLDFGINTGVRHFRIESLSFYVENPSLSLKADMDKRRTLKKYPDLWKIRLLINFDEIKFPPFTDMTFKSRKAAQHKAEKLARILVPVAKAMVCARTVTGVRMTWPHYEDITEFK
jgi:hypothetical protein